MITDEQRKTRMKSLGGSDAAAAAGLSRYMTKYELWDIKVNGNSKDIPKSSQEIMQWGNNHEKSILDKCAESLDINISFPDTKYHNKHKFLSANLDGYDAENNTVIEVKTSRRYNGWGKPGTDDIPIEYLCQVAHYCSVMDANDAYIAVLFCGSDFKIYHYNRNEKLEKNLIKKETDFWEKNVLSKTPPELSTINDARLYYSSSSESKVVASNDDLMLIDNIKDIDSKLKELSDKKNEFKRKLMCKMRDSDELVSESGITMCTWKNQSSNRIDSNKIKEINPEIYNSCLKTTNSRVFRVK
jgi:putative phage-type endonuclease